MSKQRGHGVLLLALVRLLSLLKCVDAQSLPEIELPGFATKVSGTFFGGHFTCGGIGVVGGNTIIGTTTDGGNSWSTRTPPGSQNIKGNPFVINENEAW
jgi:hypothetical protein